MKSNLFKKHKLEIGLSFMIGLSAFWSCDNALTPIRQSQALPPDLNVPTVFEGFSPDSGGVKTQLIIRGKNFGTDTTYLRVTVNNKRAAIVGVSDDVIYAIVPARADTGYIRLYVGKGDNVEEYASQKEFIYQFKRNVTTVMGRQGQDGRDDGPYAESKLRRPWAALTDKDGTVYFIEEGRGQNKDGALRRAHEGWVETLVQNSSGPFQSPTCMAFSPQQDTLYISNKSHGDDIKSSFNILYATRAGGFMDIKGLCKFEKSETQGLAVHPQTGEVFFCNRVGGFIYRFKGPNYEDYEPLFQINKADKIDTRMLFNPAGTALFVVICNRHCIYKVPYNALTHAFGEPELFAGGWDEAGYTNGSGVTARFDNPKQPAFDQDGNLFVPETGRHTIRKITPTGEVSLYAGLPGQAGFADGLPEKARFNQPECVTVYLDNSLYVTDRENHLIRRVTVE